MICYFIKKLTLMIPFLTKENFILVMVLNFIWVNFVFGIYDNISYIIIFQNS